MGAPCLVIAPIAENSVEAQLATTQQAQQAGADAAEWRMDTALSLGADADQLVAAIAASPLPVLATIRHTDERGSWTRTAAERLALYQRCDAAGARWIDCELARLDDLAGWRPARAELILSSHDFTGMGGGLAALRDRIARMHELGAIAKVAVMAGDAADLAVIRTVLTEQTQPTIALAMGEHGQPSRLLAGVWGSYLTFGRLVDQAGSAPGQPTVDELVSLYRIKQQRSDWRIFGVIGSPIAHSISPLLHNRALIAASIAAVYVPFRVEDATAFWSACGPWVSGLSITIPHKQALLPLIEQRQPDVTAIGAMNTVFRDQQQRATAANTDALAIVSCLIRACSSVDLTGKRLLCLGAGGVARAVAHACAGAGAIIAIVNRSHDKAVALAAEIPGAIAIDDATAAEWPYDLLVNGTSVGMGKPDETPWPAQRHRANTFVFDTVYTPLRTRLVRDAEAAGAMSILGLDLFIGQAQAQFQFFTGQTCDASRMREAALVRLAAKA